MIKDFLWWVAEKVGSIVFVCVSVCPSNLAPGAGTGGRIGTVEAPFERQNRGKTMVPIAERLMQRSTCQVLAREHL